MKNLFFISIYFFLISCFTDNSNSLIDNGAEFSVIGNEMYSFGEITQGTILDFEFKIKNTGSGDLIITNAKSSCSCTKLEFPKERISKGQTDLIKITFDSKNIIGLQNKKIIFTTNATPNIKILTIEGMILSSTN